MFSGLLEALCEAQETIGNQMATNSVSAETISSTLVYISQNWAGKTPGTRPDGSPNVDRDGNDLPNTGENYSVADIQAMVSWIAGLEQSATGDKLQALQAKSSDWTNTGSAMGNYADLQKSPFNTMQQGETSQIQQDQSAVSASAQLGSGLADLDGTTASVITLIA